MLWELGAHLPWMKGPSKSSLVICSETSEWRSHRTPSFHFAKLPFLLPSGLANSLPVLSHGAKRVSKFTGLDPYLGFMPIFSSLTNDGAGPRPLSHVIWDSVPPRASLFSGPHKREDGEGMNGDLPKVLYFTFTKHDPELKLNHKNSWGSPHSMYLCFSSQSAQQDTPGKTGCRYCLCSSHELNVHLSSPKSRATYGGSGPRHHCSRKVTYSHLAESPLFSHDLFIKETNHIPTLNYSQSYYKHK